MPEFYRNAWYAQLKKKVDELEEEIQKAIELPTVTSEDEGKVLMVDSNGEWGIGTVVGGARTGIVNNSDVTNRSNTTITVIAEIV